MASFNTSPEAVANTAPIEQRRFRRVSHTLPARVFHVLKSGHTFQFQGRLRDVSAGGMGLVLSHDAFGQVTIGCKAEITVERTGFQKPIRLAGRVVRSVVMEDGSCHVGLEFLTPHYILLSTFAAHTRASIRILQSQFQ